MTSLVRKLVPSSGPTHRSFGMHIGLTEARHLVAADKWGTSDPYLKVFIDGKQVHRSKTIYKTLEPKWNETIEVEVPNAEESVLRIECWDKDHLRRDDPIGAIDLRLRSLTRGVKYEAWHRLQEIEKGELKISVLPINFGQIQGKLYKPGKAEGPLQELYRDHWTAKIKEKYVVVAPSHSGIHMAPYEGQMVHLEGKTVRRQISTRVDPYKPQPEGIKEFMDSDGYVKKEVIAYSVDTIDLLE